MIYHLERKIKISQFGRMNVKVIPVREDNFAYLVINNDNKAIAIDPYDAEKVIAAAKEAGAEITSVFATHSHHDHSGGNEAMRNKLGKSLKVYGHNKRVAALTDALNDGDQVEFGNLTITALVS